MTRCRSALVALPLLALMPAAASATAALTCDIDDRNLTASLLGNVGSGVGAAIQIVGGSISVKVAAPAGRRLTLPVEPAQLVRQRISGNQLRIGIHIRPERGVALDLDITAQRIGAGGTERYRGRYALTIRQANGARTLRGAIKACEVG